MAPRFKMIFKEKGYGQRFFLDSKAPDKIAIADNSGATPDQCDDGVLYVDPTRAMEVNTEGLYVNMGVLNEAGDKFGAGCQVEGALFLMSHPLLDRLHVKMDTRLVALRQLLQGGYERPRCPKCGNTDTTQMEYVEDVEASRRILGVNRDGTMVIEDQQCADSDGANGRLRCKATVTLPVGVAGPSMCLHDFELPESLTFGDHLLEQ